MRYWISSLRNKYKGKVAVVICPSPTVKTLAYERLASDPRVVTIGINRMVFFRDLDYAFVGIDPMRLEPERFKYFAEAFEKTKSKLVLPVFAAPKAGWGNYKFAHTIRAISSFVEGLESNRDVYRWNVCLAEHVKAYCKHCLLNITHYRETAFYPNSVIFCSRSAAIGGLELAKMMGVRATALVGNDLRTNGSSITGYYVDNRVPNSEKPKEEGEFPAALELAFTSLKRCHDSGMFKGQNIMDFSNSLRRVFPRKPRKQLFDWIDEVLS